ncbi:hypothetical protein [Microbacterium sp. P02]|uniref:hypothetical protein n=1 Tax=Microbacterium sp. P02 TaxID=3366260 RepID=UPI00366F068C
MWRATAGECGGAAPTIDRSTDGGRTWRNVTPGYLGLAQIGGLDAFQSTEAEAVAGLAGSCGVNLLRTYTQGQFWDSYPTLLPVARYIDLEDASTVRLAGVSVDSPCVDARGLRAAGSTVALVCEGTAFALRDGRWSALPETDVAAVAVADPSVYVAAATADCDGLNITVHTGADVGMPVSLGCVPGSPSAAVAMAVVDGAAFVWSGNDVVRVDVP